MTSIPVTETKYLYSGSHMNLTESSAPCRDVKCIIYAVASMIVFILGVSGNGVVIWIAGFKVKKSVNTTWYLSLAMSDFLFCLNLPFFVDYTVRNDYIFGPFMCKFGTFIWFLTMFSSIFLLVIISVDRCVIVMFPVWAQNQRTIRKASVMVILAWIISAALSIPLTTFQHFSEDAQKKHCYRNYINEQNYAASMSLRFVFGFVIPFMIIIICYVFIIRRLRSKHMKSTKPFKIMTALIITFFICWMPFHVFRLLIIKYKLNKFLGLGYRFSAILAQANSCLNPFLYAFMGKDIKSQCHVSLGKMENAFGDEFSVSGKSKYSASV